MSTEEARRGGLGPLCRPSCGWRSGAPFLVPALPACPLRGGGSRPRPTREALGACWMPRTGADSQPHRLANSDSQGNKVLVLKISILA